MEKKKKRKNNNNKLLGRLFADFAITTIIFLLIMAMGYIVNFWNPGSGIRKNTKKEMQFTLRERAMRKTHTRGAEGLAVHNGVIVSGSWNDDLVLSNVDSGEPIRQIRGAHTSDIIDIEFESGGEFIASAGLDGRIRFWTAKGEFIKELPALSRNAIDLSVVTRKKESYVAAALLNGQVNVYSFETLEATAKLVHTDSGFCTAVQFLSDELLVSGASDGILVFWNAKTKEKLHSVQAHNSRVTVFALDSTKKWLASAGRDKRIVLWDRNSYKKVAEFASKEQGAVEALAFFPDGGYLFAGDRKGTILVWDLRSEKLLLSKTTSSGRIYDLRFNKKGSTVITTGYDHSLRLYDLVTK